MTVHEVEIILVIIKKRLHPKEKIVNLFKLIIRNVKVSVMYSILLLFSLDRIDVATR